ncbi:RNA-binding protein [Candidatus Woesearchaeota archaeon]|nr:RNA-binding protein [Candidatus Woesearchaeota archaeon]
MSKLLIEERAVVVPGEELAEGMDYLPGNEVIRDGDKLISTKVGVASISGRLVKVVPLTGCYLPKKGDLVIGKIVNIGLSGWRINIGWHFEANLNLRDASSDFIERGADLTKYFNYGDYVVGQIINVSGSKIIDISTKGPGLRKLGPGKLLNVSSTKVPRIIGKQGSMIALIKEYTGCKIMVGQNGLVWLSSDDPNGVILAMKAIKKIEQESHVSGLTDRMKEFLEKESKGLKKESKDGNREEN